MKFWKEDENFDNILYTLVTLTYRYINGFLATSYCCDLISLFDPVKLK